MERARNGEGRSDGGKDKISQFCQVFPILIANLSRYPRSGYSMLEFLRRSV
jgi:hypothetical protein